MDEIKFEDIILLDNEEIKKVLREVDPEDTMISLSGPVNNLVKEKILFNTSPRFAAMLIEDLEFFLNGMEYGPPQLVEERQNKILKALHDLIEQGEIHTDLSKKDLYKQRLEKSKEESQEQKDIDFPE